MWGLDIHMAYHMSRCGAKTPAAEGQSLTGMSPKLNLLPTAGQDIVIGRVKSKTITDQIGEVPY
jgi:hypothetical protein